MKTLQNFDTFNQIIKEELFLSGPGGEINEHSSNRDNFIYKINELTWLKKRFDIYSDKLTDEFIDENLDKLTDSINNIHEIINNIRE